MSSIKLVRYLFLAILFSFLLSGCGGGQSRSTYVWIDVPLDGIVFPELQPVNVEGHASGVEGISRIEIYADGDLWTTIEDPPTDGNLARFQTEWLPPGLGSFLIRVIAYGADGSASLYDEARVTFGVEEAAAVITVTPVPETGEASVQFWADPATIQADDCTTIHWQAENVKSLVFGGAEQEMEGTFQACLCKNETYTLTVTQLDDTEEKLKVNITVTGTCADTTAPPAPAQSVPANGLSIDCKSYQDLVWVPVSDESGISEYRVEVQRHSGDNNWSTVSGSTFTGIAVKKLNIYVECGWTYRWRVMAVDGAGNYGPWSGWWHFVINLN